MTGTGRQRKTRHTAARWFLSCAAGLLLCCGALLDACSACAAAECTNETVRAAQDAQALPDCRAYEMVSPPRSAPAAITSTYAFTAGDGERFGYLSWNPYQGQNSEAMFLLSTRGSAGWSSQSATPPQGGLHESSSGLCNPAIYYSAEMNVGVLADGYLGRGVCDGDEPPLVAGEPRGVANLFLRDNETGSYRLIDPFPLGGGSPENAFLVDGTPDLSHVVFSERAALTAEAPGGGVPDVYEWSAGTTRLVSVLPDGSGSEGELADGQPEEADAASLTHAVAAGGERAFFYIQKGGPLYVRINAMQQKSSLVAGVCVEPAKACTLQVDAAEAGAEGPGGGGVFVDASQDGSRVFFIDEHRLTTNATAVVGKPDLYEYSLETRKLTDLTVDAGEPADVVGGTGEAEDGSYLYFVATGVLTGAQTNSHGATATAGEPNLYVVHENRTVFVATLVEGERFTTSVAPNGQFIAFTSTASLTGYDNQPREPEDCGGEACREIFLYDATAQSLACVSCAPEEAKPTGPANLRQAEGILWYGGPLAAPRDVLDNGRVFFDTRTPLLVQAQHEVENVYEYQAGKISLISTGSSLRDSEFLGASATGDDIFFTTDQQLVAADTDNADTVYDARVDGGFEGIKPPPPPPPCETAETCKQPPKQVPGRVLAGSVTFSGEGNIIPQPGGGGGKGIKKHKRCGLRRGHKPPACKRAGHRGKAAKRPQQRSTGGARKTGGGR